MKQESSFLAKLANGSLVLQILVGIIAGVALASFSHEWAKQVAF